MTAALYQLPSAGPPAREGLNLSTDEVIEASGGYLRAADQLRALRDRGFTRAYIPTVGRKRVVLERAHYDAVVRGQFGGADPDKTPERPPATPNRAGLRELFQSKRKK